MSHSRSTPIALPRIRQNVADKIGEWLVTSYGMRRPPAVARQVLALIVELHAKRRAFPLRSEAADLIGCTVFGLDAAISSALARGLITIEMTTGQGRVMQRDSAIRHRHYIPTPVLLAVAGAGAAARVQPHASSAPGRGVLSARHAA